MSASTERKLKNELADKYVEGQHCSSTDEEAELEAAFKAGWDAAVLEKAKPSSKLLTDLLSYVRGWAETTTEDECSTDGDMKVVDRNILRARKIMQKHGIEFANPTGDYEED